MTGTSSERSSTSAWNVSSVTSMTHRPGVPGPAPGAGALARGSSGFGAGLHGGEIDRACHRAGQRGRLSDLPRIGT